MKPQSQVMMAVATENDVLPMGAGGLGVGSRHEAG